MAHKRKRSDSTSSPLSTSSFSRSSVSPSPLTGQSHLQDSSMDLDAPIQAHPSPAHAWMWDQMEGVENASGRTMKRFRDNRPDERAIHESTLRRLYTAQREHPTASPLPSHEPPLPTASSQPAQKSTLHQFWHISKPPSQPPAAAIKPILKDPENARCEDCDASLAPGECMDMDLDGPGAPDDFACRHCKRAVCGSCSISRDVRSCLNCAMG